MLFHHQSRRRLSAIFLQLQSLKRFSRFNFGFLSGFLSHPRVYNQETQTFSTSTSSSSPSFATVSSVSAGDIITVNLNTSSSSSSSTSSTSSSSTSSSSTSSFSNATPYSLVRFERGAVGLVIDVKKNVTLRVALVAGAQPNPGEAALFSADGTISTFGKGKQGIDQLSTTTTTTTSDNGSNSSIDGFDSIKPSLSSSPLLKSTITSASLVVDVNRRGREFCGRVVDCLGRPIDGKGPLSSSNSTTTSIDDELHNNDERGSNSTENISSSSLFSSSSSSGSMTNVPLFFRNSPSIVSRSRINKTLTTGYKAIDGFNPISLGTGNLITGEHNSGKQKTVLEIISTLSKKIDRAALASSASSASYNQEEQQYIDDELNDEIKNPSAIVYVLTGCSVSAAKNAVKSLRDSGALHNTAVIVSTANEPCGAQYMSIFTGLALGESIRDSGGRALVIVDNLTRLFVSARRVAGESTLATSSSSLASPVVSQTVGALFDRAAQLSESHGGGSLTVLSLMDTPPSMSNSMINDNISNSAGESLSSSSSMTGRGMSPGSHGLSSGSTRLGGKSLDTSLFDYTRSLADTIIEFSSTGYQRSSGSLIPIDFNSLSMTSRSHRSQGKGFQLASRNAREVLCELREISKNVAIAQSVGVTMESEFDAAISMLTKAKLLVLPTTSLLNEVLAENTIDGEDEEVERVGGGGGGLSEKVVKLTIEGIPSSSSSSSSTLTSITKRMYSTTSTSSFKRSYSTSSALFSKDDPFSTITNTKSSSSSSSSPDKAIDKLVNKLDSAQLRTLLAVSGSRLRKSAAAVAAQANIAHARPPSSQASSSSTTTPLIDVAVKAARRAKIDVDMDGSLDTTTARSKEGEEEGGRSSNSKSNSRSAEFSFSALYGKRSPSSTVNQQTTTSPLSSSVSSSSSIRSKPPPPVSVAAAVIEDEEVIEGEAFHETLKRLEEKEKEKKGLASSTTSSTTSTTTSSPSTTAISNDSRDSTLSSAAHGTRKFSTFARQSRAYSSTSSSLSSSLSSLPSSFRKLQLPPQVFADAVIKPVSKTAKESSDNQDPSSSFSSSSSVLSTWEDSPIRGDRKRTFLVLFCIANGYLARVPLKRVFEFEAGLYTLLTRLPPPNRHRKESVKNSSSSSTSSSSSPHMSLLDKVIERGAGNDLFLINTSRTIHQSLKALELRRITLNARIAKEESKKREEEAILAEKKRKEEKNARGSTGGSTFASFFFGGGRGASSSSTTTPPSSPSPSASSSSNGTSLDTLPPSSPTSSFSSSSSSSFSFDDLIEGGSIAPEGIQAIHRLLEITSTMTNQTHVSSVPPSDNSINKNKREEEGIDGTTINKDLLINTKGQEITYNEEMIDDIACLAALHVSVASFIKIVFEDEK